jgi:hypothetical protein
VHPVGEFKNSGHRVFELSVTKAFLQAGIPLEKASRLLLKEVIEHGAFAIRGPPGLRQNIPAVLDEEVGKVKNWLKEGDVSIIFDGTSHVCEVTAAVARKVTADFRIEQKLVHVKLYAVPLDGAAASAFLAGVVLQRGVPEQSVLAFMRDRSSVNNVAIDMIRNHCKNSVDIGCFSHTLDHVGARFAAKVLSQFISAYSASCSFSPKARSLWRARSGKNPKRQSTTRWWSHYEVAASVYANWSRVGDWLKDMKAQDVSPAFVDKMMEIKDDADASVKLSLELTAMVEAAKPFVQATYRLEGDGFLAINAYAELMACDAFINLYNTNPMSALPSTDAAINTLAAAAPVADQQAAKAKHWAHIKTMLKPGFDYFKARFITQGIAKHNLWRKVELFRVARLFDPTQIGTLPASDIPALASFPFLNDPSRIASLTSEFPTYQARAAGVSPQVDVLLWWRQNGHAIPAWTVACRQMILVQPSSAAVERVFSMLNASIGDDQRSMLGDAIEASLMLQYNYSSD